MESVQIKICGITSIADALLLNEHQVDYAGFVLFFPKSKRNLTIEEALPVLNNLNASIKRVAVVVSPDSDQITQIEKAGFDMIQIHGKLLQEAVDLITIPIFRAFHMGEMNEILDLEPIERFDGFVLDGKNPGAGKVFDWELTKQFNRQNKKLMLAGGLNADNVLEGIHQVIPDIVDVSSGVEMDIGRGKDPDKVRTFVETVRNRKSY